MLIDLSELSTYLFTFLEPGYVQTTYIDTNYETTRYRRQSDFSRIWTRKS